MLCFFFRCNNIVICINVLAERPRIQAIDFNCSGTADKEQGTINTPNYPDYYDNNNLCTWLISSSHRVKLVFTTFSLESGWDFLYVYDGNSHSSTLLGTFDGYLPGHVVESSAEHLFLEFTSDLSVTRQGFLIRLEGWYNLYPPKFGSLSKNLANDLQVIACKPGIIHQGQLITMASFPSIILSNFFVHKCISLLKVIYDMN